MKNNNFEYFLNAVHYSLWISDMKFGDFIGRIVNVLLSPIPKYLFTKDYKKKYYERLPQEQKKMEKFFGDKEVGCHICIANHLFGYFYSGYPLFLSFILAGLILREYGDLDNFMKLAILVIPIGLCYIPAYRAVFTNDKYLDYFKQFGKQDEQWHKKWRRITFAFCFGSVVVSISGIGLAFAIAIIYN